MISNPTPPAPPDAHALPGPDAPSPRPRGRVWRWLRLLGALILALAIVGTGTALGLARYGGAYTAHAFSTRLELPDPATVKGDPAAKAEKLAGRLATLAPKDVYVVVDTHNNRLRVYRGAKLLREAVCSTGSGIKLRDPRDGREWFFDTPQGEFKILRKQKNPLWIKPDWAFIEEGYLPPKNARDRVDDFSLGDYGLYMRDGYIIHGTIFKTLLGKRVTHGCIRLGDEDLKFVFDTVPTDARVYLF
ncbi:MAG: L,D-transpeptidase [Thermoanaerobaculia bacterium]|nr:L,D-transpeptidase [Thermoanaerobaculia bacterium]